MEILTFQVNELDEMAINYLRLFGYKEDDYVDVASWVTEDDQVMNIIVPSKE